MKNEMRGWKENVLLIYMDEMVGSVGRVVEQPIQSQVTFILSGRTRVYKLSTLMII